MSYTNIFFTSKNTMVIILLIYRLVVVNCEKQGQHMGSQEDGNSKTKTRTEKC